MYDNNNQINATEQKPSLEQYLDAQKPKRSWWKKLLFRLLEISFYAGVFVVMLFAVFYVYGRAGNPKSDSLSWINRIPIIGQIKSIAQGSTAPLNGQERGQINILLLGIGGKGHDGGELTDTIMVASVDVATKKVSLLSIPRDLSVPIENMGWRKINAVNSYAEQKQTGSGGLATSQTVADVIGAPIDYYVKVDFDGFEQLINDLGGLDICVDRTFDDYTYPIFGREEDPVYTNRFEHLHIEAGCQKMDSALALKYARSRHALGPEGTDFARAARQQKVIQAAKEKLLSKSAIFNPKILSEIVTNMNDHVSTDLKVWEMAQLWSLVKDVKKEDVLTKVLSNSPEGLLMDSVGYDGAYLLVPRTGNFSEVQYLFKNMFNAVPVETKTVVKTGNVKVQILNGTWINGLASKTSVDLEKLGFKITGVTNSSHQDFETSVIYDLTFGQKEEALKILKEKLGANVSFNLPNWLKDDLAKILEGDKTAVQPDLILILGQNANRPLNN